MPRQRWDTLNPNAAADRLNALDDPDSGRREAAGIALGVDTPDEDAADTQAKQDEWMQKDIMGRLRQEGVQQARQAAATAKAQAKAQSPDVQNKALVQQYKEQGYHDLVHDPATGQVKPVSDAEGNPLRRRFGTDLYFNEQGGAFRKNYATNGFDDAWTDAPVKRKGDRYVKDLGRGVEKDVSEEPEYKSKLEAEGLLNRSSIKARDAIDNLTVQGSAEMNRHAALSNDLAKAKRAKTETSLAFDEQRGKTPMSDHPDHIAALKAKTDAEQRALDAQAAYDQSAADVATNKPARSEQKAALKALQRETTSARQALRKGQTPDADALATAAAAAKSSIRGATPAIAQADPTLQTAPAATEPAPTPPDVQSINAIVERNAALPIEQRPKMQVAGGVAMQWEPGLAKQAQDLMDGTPPAPASTLQVAQTAPIAEASQHLEAKGADLQARAIDLKGQEDAALQHVRAADAGEQQLQMENQAAIAVGATDVFIPPEIGQPWSMAVWLRYKPVWQQGKAAMAMATPDMQRIQQERDAHNAEVDELNAAHHALQDRAQKEAADRRAALHAEPTTKPFAQQLDTIDSDTQARLAQAEEDYEPGPARDAATKTIRDAHQKQSQDVADSFNKTDTARRDAPKRIAAEQDLADELKTLAEDEDATQNQVRTPEDAKGMIEDQAKRRKDLATKYGVDPKDFNAVSKKVQDRAYSVDDGKVRFAPYSVSPDEQPDPKQLFDGVTQAVKDGLIKPLPAREQRQMEDAKLDYEEKVKAAGGDAQFKSALRGVGKAGAFMAGAAAAAPLGAYVGAKAGLLAGPYAEVASPVLGTVGGVAAGLEGGTEGSKLYSDVVMPWLGKYSKLLDSVNKSAELHPGFEQAGELAGFALAPTKIANLLTKASRAEGIGNALKPAALRSIQNYRELAKVAADQVGEAGGAVDAARSAAAANALFKAGGSAVGGAALFTGVQYAFEGLTGNKVDWSKVPEDLGTNVALGLLLHGNSLEFKDVNATDMASLITRGAVRERAGLSPNSVGAQGELKQAFADAGITFANPAIEKEMLSPMSSEEAALYKNAKEKTAAMVKGGAEGVDFEGGRVASIPKMFGGNEAVAAAAVKPKERGQAPEGPAKPPGGGLPSGEPDTLTQATKNAASDAELDANPNPTGESLARIARGEKVETMPEAQLNAVGLTHDGDKVKPIKGKDAEGNPIVPSVQIDGRGSAIILQPAIDALKQTHPATAALVGMSEQEAREHFQQGKDEETPAESKGEAPIEEVSNPATGAPIVTPEKAAALKIAAEHLKAAGKSHNIAHLEKEAARPSRPEPPTSATSYKPVDFSFLTTEENKALNPILRTRPDLRSPEQKAEYQRLTDLAKDREAKGEKPAVDAEVEVVPPTRPLPKPLERYTTKQELEADLSKKHNAAAGSPMLDLRITPEERARRDELPSQVIGKGPKSVELPKGVTIERQLPKNDPEYGPGQGSVTMLRDGQRIGGVTYREEQTDNYTDVTKGATTYRIGDIRLEKGEQGQGHGKRLYLEALAQHPEGWFFNSQTYTAAGNALRSLAREGLIKLRETGHPALGDIGPNVKQITEKGMRAIGRGDEWEAAAKRQQEASKPRLIAPEEKLTIDADVDKEVDSLPLGKGASAEHYDKIATQKDLQESIDSLKEATDQYKKLKLESISEPGKLGATGWAAHLKDQVETIASIKRDIDELRKRITKPQPAPALETAPKPGDALRQWLTTAPEHQETGNLAATALDEYEGAFPAIHLAEIKGGNSGGIGVAANGDLYINPPKFLKHLHNARTAADAGTLLSSILGEEFEHRISLDLESKSPTFAANLKKLVKMAPRSFIQEAQVSYFRKYGKRLSDADLAHELFARIRLVEKGHAIPEEMLKDEGVMQTIKDLLREFIAHIKELLKGNFAPKVKAIYEELKKEAEALEQRLKKKVAKPETPSTPPDDGGTLTHPQGAGNARGDLPGAADDAKGKGAPAGGADRGSGETGGSAKGNVQVPVPEASGKALADLRAKITQNEALPQSEARDRRLAAMRKRVGELGGTVDTNAHDAATSPKNDLAEPTTAQKDAGNYPKGHVALNGLNISIENPAGSERSGDGWKVTMKDHYGYIKGSVGADNEHVDVFIKPGTPLDYAGPVFVVNQLKPDGSFDEHKAMVGYADSREARDAYFSNYAEDWTGGGSMQTFTWDQFKAKLDAHAFKKAPKGTANLAPKLTAAVEPSGKHPVDVIWDWAHQGVMPTRDMDALAKLDVHQLRAAVRGSRWGNIRDDRLDKMSKPKILEDLKATMNTTVMRAGRDARPPERAKIDAAKKAYAEQPTPSPDALRQQPTTEVLQREPGEPGAKGGGRVEPSEPGPQAAGSQSPAKETGVAPFEAKEEVTTTLSVGGPEGATKLEVKAIAKEKAKPEIAKQTTPVDPKAASGQKKFLLHELENALKDAPDTQGQPTTEAGKDYSALLYQGHLPEQRKALIDTLLEKYDIPKDQTTYHETTLAPEKFEIKYDDRVDILRARLRESSLRDLGIAITIDVPGDGSFSIVNTKAALREFLTKAKKFPVSTPKPAEPKAGGPSKPTSIPALKTVKSTEDVVKALYPHASDDEDRAVLNGVMSDGENLVATDGRRLIVIDHKGPGASDKPVLLDEGGKDTEALGDTWITKVKDSYGKIENIVDISEKPKYKKGQTLPEGTVVSVEKGMGANYPSWKQVLPPKESQIKVGKLDTGRMFTILQQAKGVEVPDESRAVTLYINPDKTIGLKASSEVGEYEHNIQPGGAILTAYNRSYLMDIMRTARGLGHETLNYSVGREEGGPGSSSMFNAPGMRVVLMPMKLEKGNPSISAGARAILDPKSVQAEDQPEGTLQTAPSVSPEDSDYMAAVEAGDMESAQRMVDAAAEKAGYLTRPFYHGTPDGRFSTFEKDRGVHEVGIGGFAFSDSPKVADEFRGGLWVKRDALTNRDDWKTDSEGDIVKAYPQHSEVKKVYLDLSNADQWDMQGGAYDEAFVTKALENAKRDGKTAVVFHHMRDGSYGTLGKWPQSNVAFVFEPSQIKLADPVTYDSAGDPIPISERFNPRFDSILFTPGAEEPTSEMPEDAAGTRRAYTDPERERADMMEYSSGPVRHWESVVMPEARAILAANSHAGEALVNRLLRGATAISDTDRAVLTLEFERRRQDFDNAVARVNSTTDPTALLQARRDYALAKDRHYFAMEAANLAGSESGRSLNAIRIMLKEDFSLAKLLARARAANGGVPLNDEQEALWTRIAKERADWAQKEETYKQQAAEMAAQLAAMRSAGRGHKPASNAVKDLKEAARARIMARKGMLQTAPAADESDDEAYLAAVKSGDTATAQRMVDEAAKRAGYNVGPVHHGSIGGEVPSQFDKRDITFFTPDESVSKEYAGTAGKTGAFHISLNNPLEAHSAKDILGLLPEHLQERHKNARYSWEVLKDKDLPDLYEDADVIEALKDLGYDGLKIHDDVVTRNGALESHGVPSFAVFDPAAIKSADPITYDSAGNPILLSERFNPKSDDILQTAPAAPELQDLIDFGAGVIGDGHEDFAAWANAMEAEIPGELEGHDAQAIFDEATKLYKSLTTKDTSPKGVLDGIKAKRETISDLTSADLNRLALSLIRTEGITDVDVLTTRLHEEVNAIFPGVTREEVARAWTNIENATYPNQAPEHVKLRDLRRQEAAIQKKIIVRDEKRIPDKSGPQRDAPSDDARQLERELADVIKDSGLQPADPAKQLASTQSRITNALKNRLTDLQRQVAAGKREVRSAKANPETPEMRRLRDEIDALNQKLNALDPKNPKPPGQAQRIKIAEAAAERAIKNLDLDITDLNARIAAGNLAPLPKATKTPLTSADLDALRKTKEAKIEARDALRDQLEDLRAIAKGEILDPVQDMMDRFKKAATPTVKNARRTLSWLEHAAKAYLDPKATAHLRSRWEKDAMLLGATKDQAEGMRQILDEELDRRDRFANAAANRRIQKAIERNIAKATAYDEDNPLPPKTPQQRKLDAQGEIYTANRIKSEREARAAMYAMEQRNRSRALKIFTGVTDWSRFCKVMGVKIFGKLGAAATGTFIAEPIESFASTVASGAVSIPGVRSLPIVRDVRHIFQTDPHGYGLSLGWDAGRAVQAEAGRVYHGIVNGWSNFGERVKSGSSNWEKPHEEALGENSFDAMNQSWMRYGYNAHMALKGFAVDGERFASETYRSAWAPAFKREMEGRIAKAMRNGVDLTDPLAQSFITNASLVAAMDEAYQKQQAYLDSQFIRLGNKNWIESGVKAIQRYVRTNEQLGAAGPYVEQIAKFLLPIVKIPTNWAMRTYFYSPFGLVHSAVETAIAINNGVEKLTPEQAAIIRRHWAKGAVGMALFLLGWFSFDDQNEKKWLQAGGYYQDRERRKDGAVKAGRFRLFGKDVPLLMTHTPALWAIQMGATARSVLANYDKKAQKAQAKKGAPLPSGTTRFLESAEQSALAIGKGMGEELPFIHLEKDMSDLTNKEKVGTALGKMAFSAAVPRVVSEAAELQDPAEGRKPKSFTDALKVGVPKTPLNPVFNRQSVGLKEGKNFKDGTAMSGTQYELFKGLMKRKTQEEMANPHLRYIPTAPPGTPAFKHSIPVPMDGIIREEKAHRKAAELTNESMEKYGRDPVWVRQTMEALKPK